jgi:hypothetical protein
MPFDATISDACNSPVEGLYNNFALLVYTVVGVPLVAFENMGYRFDAVLVSLLIVAPETTVAQDVVVPSVVRYLPVLLVWLGAKALKAEFAVV